MSEPPEPAVVLVIAGPPGVGKTSVAIRAAADLKAAHVEIDRLWPARTASDPAPWEERGQSRTRAVIRGGSAAAAVIAATGFIAVIDFALSPGHLDDVLAACSQEDVSCHYVVLRASPEAVKARADSRGLSNAETEALPMMIAEFADLGDLEDHVIETSEMTVAEVAAALVEGLERGVWLLNRDTVERAV